VGRGGEEGLPDVLHEGQLPPQVAAHVLEEHVPHAAPLAPVADDEVVVARLLEARVDAGACRSHDPSAYCGSAGRPHAWRAPAMEGADAHTDAGPQPIRIGGMFRSRVLVAEDDDGDWGPMSLDFDLCGADRS